MKRKYLDTIISRSLIGAVALILVLMPFHAFLTVWLSSFIGHYTALRLWKEVLLLLAALLALYLIIVSPYLCRELLRRWLWRFIVAYAVVNLLWGIVAYNQGAVTPKAVLYGELLNLRFLAMMLVGWVAASRSDWLIARWRQLVLIPAAIVVLVGLLQRFLLPYDVMKHFGYNAKTIWPYETIDHKVSYIRIRSTLRGANLLGGYMIMVISLLVLLLAYAKRRLVWLLAIIASLIVLFASGSRGAWLGTLAALFVLAILQLPNRRIKIRALVLSLAVLLVAVAGLVALRNNDFVQNTFFHTDEHSSSNVSSNDAHFKATFDAAHQVASEPLGRGPGTAGPASFYNAGHSVRIAENYFLQIGQETGWLGLGLFLVIYGLVARELWRRRAVELAQVLLASFVGLSVMGMLMHIWTDDTLAYLFWGLTGIALAAPSLVNRNAASPPSRPLKIAPKRVRS